MSERKSIGQVFKELSPEKQKEVLSQLTDEEVNHILYDWSCWRRKEQHFDFSWPEQITMILAGRGFGKTRTLAETVRDGVNNHGLGSITLVAPTSQDLRETLTEGGSGILACAGPYDKYKPTYVPSKSRIEYNNGARVRLISAEQPSRLRGQNSDFIGFDELCAYEDPDAFHQAIFGLRIAPAKALICTTPKATPLMVQLSKRFDKDIRVIRGSTFDNASNLSPNFIEAVKATYEGTRMGDAELYGKLLLTSEDALWNMDTIAANMVEEHELPIMVKYALAIDPAVSNNKKSDLTGIVLVGLGEDDQLYILKDVSGKYSPQGWATKVLNIYDDLSRFAPVIIVVETNQGGMFCTQTLTRERAFLPIKEVFHTANKMARASPIAILSEQGKVKHLKGSGLTDLEDEMVSYDGKSSRASPNRYDAMVMACSHLMPSKRSFVTSREFLI